MRLGHIVLILSSAIIISGVVFTALSGIRAAQPFLSQNIVVANGIINPGTSKIIAFNVSHAGPTMYIVLKSDPPNIPLRAAVKDPNGSIVSTSTFSQDLVANFRTQVEGKYDVSITNQGTEQVKTDTILGYLPMLGENEKPNMSALIGIFIGVLLILIGTIALIEGIVLVLKYRARRNDEYIYSLLREMVLKIIAYIRQPIAKRQRSSYPTAKQELIADELTKLQRLRQEGIILESEFLQRKQELMKDFS